MYDLDILSISRASPECQTLIPRGGAAIKVSKAATIWIGHHKTHSKKYRIKKFDGLTDCGF